MTDQADIIRNRRRLFAMPGGSHDRLVAFLARFLPAGIGAVVAVMVIAPLFPRGEVSFLLDRNKVALTTERLRVEQAMYRGEDQRGRPFSVTAGKAVQHSNAVPVVQMNDLSARILLKDGPAELKAGSARYDVRANALDVAGPIDFRAADGYRMTTSNVQIDLKAQQVTGTGGVAGAVPSGTFSADRIEADLDERVVALKGRAHLRMQGTPGGGR
ncbi:LPS export ABC transporter periplasmic protein LptC [Novosphingobium flavum]|uniref:LPS export ABC transporter periplasmic protein LptC n=1 Tax=Novosphingobium aerophilum TaxID=2839843 RepID=A0A7X1F7R2_9SPHN|nr:MULTISPECIES: LPS export ABC transporter periplasmic protein LptC [Novosphingobium]MBC2651913.1 LPS export ABC transporter periplasmic protein LptC [Novosphingobium aerophilum]MBC2661688.1 LPS export ABC transporter periplasmic protein LptC [Novosphingobium aerophilum]